MLEFVYMRGLRCYSFFSLLFFFKQKTAYEMRISDWSSDVCSSDLAEALHLALVAQRVDGLHLDLEDLLHRRLDLRLAGVQRHHEGDLVVLGAERRLLGHHRAVDNLVHTLRRHPGRLAVPCACAAHFRRASNASPAPLVSTRASRRRMSYTLAPCCGSTSTSGRLRVALTKPPSTCAPSMISTEDQPRAANFFARSEIGRTHV